MALENDTQAPDFDLPNQFGEHVRLTDFQGKKPVALVFFPLAFSGTCTTELCSLRDNLSMFKQNGVELIGISVDSKATLRAWAESEGYDFTLLADFWPHGAVSKEYGVFLDAKGFANRATFIIDVRGTIRASFITAPGEARSIDEYRAALESVLPTHV
jgi:peroxiredoxin